MTRILVTKRSYDYRACIEGLPAICANGVTVEAAVRNLLVAGREHFDGPVEVVYQLQDEWVEETLCRSSRA